MSGYSLFLNDTINEGSYYIRFFLHMYVLEMLVASSWRIFYFKKISYKTELTASHPRKKILGRKNLWAVEEQAERERERERISWRKQRKKTG